MIFFNKRTNEENNRERFQFLFNSLLYSSQDMKGGFDE
jgi:hypothetical protein